MSLKDLEQAKTTESAGNKGALSKKFFKDEGDENGDSQREQYRIVKNQTNDTLHNKMILERANKSILKIHGSVIKKNEIDLTPKLTKFETNLYKSASKEKLKPEKQMK